MAADDTRSSQETVKEQDARLVEAMERIAHAGETRVLHLALEDLAAAEQRYGYALRASGHADGAQEMLDRAVAHYQEAARLARDLAHVRRTEREILDDQRAARAGISEI